MKCVFLLSLYLQLSLAFQIGKQLYTDSSVSDSLYIYLFIYSPQMFRKKASSSLRMRGISESNRRNKFPFITFLDGALTTKLQTLFNASSGNHSG